MAQGSAGASIQVEVTAMKRLFRWGALLAVPLSLLALSAGAGTGPAAGRAKPVKPRTLVTVNAYIQSFAQSGDAVAWIDWRDRVYLKPLSKSTRSFVGSALGGGNRATLEYTPLLTLVGTRAFWTIYDGGNSVEIGIFVSEPGKKRSLIDVIGSDPDGSGTGGYFPSLVSDGPRLVYGFASVHGPENGWPTDCSQLELGDKGVKVIAGPPYVTNGHGSSFIPAMPSVMMLDASQGRIAVVPARWQVPPGDRCAELAVGENGPVEVYDLAGTRLARLVPAGTVEAVALSWPQLAVLVRRHQATKAIERYDARTGALLTATTVSSKVSEISMGTRGIAYSAGSSIYLLSGSKPMLVWRSTGAPIGVSIEGSRIAWAVNGRPSLIRALRLP
jgi:hypothetical protein